MFICNLFSINPSLIFEFSIRTTRDTDVTFHPNLTMSSSFMIYVPSNLDFIMVFNLNTNTHANPNLISCSLLFYLTGVYPTRIFFAPAICFSSVTSQSIYSPIDY